MRLEFFARAALFGAALALAGCSPLHKLTRIGGSCHDHKPYMSARSVPPLRVPPGLDPADTSSDQDIYVKELPEQIAASITAGGFCLLISYLASERPNSENARALAALGDRLLAVEDGDLISPPPAIVRRNMPEVAAAVDTLFSEVRSSIENAQALGMYDPVTSLPNRLHFRSEADRLLGGASPGSRSAMLFVDLDRFKTVNDSLGHARGDQLLIMVANRLRVVVTAEIAEKSCKRLTMINRVFGA